MNVNKSQVDFIGCANHYSVLTSKKTMPLFWCWCCKNITSDFMFLQNVFGRAFHGCPVKGGAPYTAEFVVAEVWLMT